RCRDWKIVLYLDDGFGELYDLRNDPGETRNLWDHADHRERRDTLRSQSWLWVVGKSLGANRKPGRAPQGALRPG
ncbi:MAG: hypothetical protein ABIP08_03705, partial [Lautropia sp.]